MPNKFQLNYFSFILNSRTPKTGERKHQQFKTINGVCEMKNLVLHRVLIICLQRLFLRNNHHHTIPEHEKGHNENLTSGSPPIIRCPGRKTQRRRQGRRGEELLARCGRCITYISLKDAQTHAHAPRSSIRLKHIPRPGVNFLVFRWLRSPIHEGPGWADVGPRVFITR